MRPIVLIFPHQLYWPHPALERYPEAEVHLIEEELFFGDWRYPLRFHRQKLILHRASMKAYSRELEGNGFDVHYFDYCPHSLKSWAEGIDPKRTVACADPTDYLLSKRLKIACLRGRLLPRILDSPNFLNTPTVNSGMSSRSRRYMAAFYKEQRIRYNVLMEGDNPLGGRWSFDEENRKKLPKTQLGDLPQLQARADDEWVEEAKAYVEKYFPKALGRDNPFYWPVTRSEAEEWLERFITERLPRFGPFEDAFEPGETVLYHSALTPMLNIGLLNPREIVAKTLAQHKRTPFPLPSLEGFLRQVIGWREFIRLNYEELGVTMRVSNHWGHNRELPPSFYEGTTGMPPVDDAIKRLLATGYCHHIERLMVLGNFLFLCEIHPDPIYRWFMELFVDSYDWVMVPNVYAMSQNADGGLITTKPYFSGSNYIRKMSHYPAGDWTKIWDALYWRWILKHAESLKGSHRWSMMVSMALKKSDSEKQKIQSVADDYLERLFS